MHLLTKIQSPGRPCALYLWTPDSRCKPLFLVFSYTHVLPFVAEIPFILLPDCWLKVGIRKVLRPAISAQVFLGFPVSVYKRMLRWFPKLQVATACFSCSSPRFKYTRSLIMFMYMYVTAVTGRQPNCSKQINNNRKDFMPVSGLHFFCFQRHKRICYLMSHFHKSN